MVLALIWWNGKRGDGLAAKSPWEELFLFSLYQMRQSLPLVARERCMSYQPRGSPQLLMMRSSWMQYPQTQEIDLGTAIHLAL